MWSCDGRWGSAKNQWPDRDNYPEAGAMKSWGKFERSSVISIKRCTQRNILCLPVHHSVHSPTRQIPKHGEIFQYGSILSSHMTWRSTSGRIFGARRDHSPLYDCHLTWGTHLNTSIDRSSISRSSAMLIIPIHAHRKEIKVQPNSWRI